MVLPDLGAYLVTQSIGTLGTNLFLGHLPPTPDSAVAILEYGGLAPEHDLGHSTQRHEFPRVQVLVRDTVYATARLKAQDIMADMAAIGNTTLSGVWYMGVDPIQQPFLLERDDNGRWVMACNYQVHKAVSSS
jgi:hypothetical protein